HRQQDGVGGGEPFTTARVPLETTATRLLAARQDGMERVDLSAGDEVLPCRPRCGHQREHPGSRYADSGEVLRLIGGVHPGVVGGDVDGAGATSPGRNVDLHAELRGIAPELPACALLRSHPQPGAFDREYLVTDQLHIQEQVSGAAEHLPEGGSTIVGGVEYPGANAGDQQEVGVASHLAGPALRLWPEQDLWLHRTGLCRVTDTEETVMGAEIEVPADPMEVLQLGPGRGVFGPTSTEVAGDPQAGIVGDGQHGAGRIEGEGADEDIRAG